MATQLESVFDKDRTLRKEIADYYMLLKELNDPDKAVQLLAEHVTIMVEMINEFKK